MKKWSLRMLCLIVAMASFSQLGIVRGEDTKATKPAIVPNPAHDPTKPVPGGVRWFGRNHAKYVQQTQSMKIDLCFLGDSITAMWPGNLFSKYYGKYKVVNFGVGGDRTENVLWRLENGELKGQSPKVVVLMIGTNNLGFNTVEEVALGVETVVKNLQGKFPKTKILLLGILPKLGNAQEPTEKMLVKIEKVNAITSKLDDGKMIRYLDFGPKFLDNDKKIQGGILADGVHLTGKGYEIWATSMNPLLTEMMEK